MLITFWLQVVPTPLCYPHFSGERSTLPVPVSSYQPLIPGSHAFGIPPKPLQGPCCPKPPSRRPLLWPVSAPREGCQLPQPGPTWPGMLQHPGAQSNLSSWQGELLHIIPRATASPRPGLQPSDSADLCGPPPQEMPPGVKHVKTELIPSPEPCLWASGPAVLSARRTLPLWPSR